MTYTIFCSFSCDLGVVVKLMLMFSGPLRCCKGNDRRFCGLGDVVKFMFLRFWEGVKLMLVVSGALETL